jgi:hypothetical protein
MPNAVWNWSSNSSAVNNICGELGRSPWYVGLPSAWDSVGDDHSFSTALWKISLTGECKRYEWMNKSFFCKRIISHDSGQFGNHGAGAHWLGTMREMSDFHYHGILLGSLRYVWKKVQKIGISDYKPALGAHLPRTLREMKKATGKGASLSWGLEERVPYLWGSWISCKGKPMKSVSLSLRALLRNIEGFLYRRLWKTAKIVLWKRIASPCRNSACGT